jgi:hypothetical protein
MGLHGVLQGSFTLLTTFLGELCSFLLLPKFLKAELFSKLSVSRHSEQCADIIFRPLMAWCTVISSGTDRPALSWRSARRPAKTKRNTYRPNSFVYYSVVPWNVMKLSTSALQHQNGCQRTMWRSSVGQAWCDKTANHMGNLMHWALRAVPDSGSKHTQQVATLHWICLSWNLIRVFVCSLRPNRRRLVSVQVAGKQILTRFKIISVFRLLSPGRNFRRIISCANMGLQT